MDEINTKQSNEDQIAELKKLLEEAKAKNQMLEREMKYKDKLTGFWNRKYAEKFLSETDLSSGNQGFSIVCVEIGNLNAVNAAHGTEAGDALIKRIAFGLRQIFGSDSVCCKMAGLKICVFVNMKLLEFNEKVSRLDTLISSVKSSYSEVDVSYGYARHDAYPEKIAVALLSEAEYELQLHKLSKQNDDHADNVMKRVRRPDDEIVVLMIDDSLLILKTMQMMLKNRFKVLMASAGMEGYEIARSKQPDIILLDYNMPEVDGERIMHLLKKNNTTKDIPVIFISGVTDKKKILRVASLKPAGYLLKPVQKENLLSVIYSVLKSEEI